MNRSAFRRIGLCSGICLLALAATSAWAAASEQPPSWVDRDRFPEAYSILTSDRVMFPDDISDWPLKIDSTHQLFVDDFLISEIDHLTRQFHQPTKHAGNPLMLGGTVAVVYDSDRGQFRMWNGARYLTSTDGVHWDKPDLGPDGNKVFFDGGDLRGLMYNPDIPEAQGRYKAVVERRVNGEDESIRFYLHHSRDGLHWEQRPEGPVLMQTVNNMLPHA